MGCNIFALIVIYNKCCVDSVSYNNLKQIKGLEIIVCDNSTIDFGNKEVVKNDNNHYISMGGNSGLSKAYNKALEFLKGRDGILCLFDDDTMIPAVYFDELQSLCINAEWDICLPRVMCETGLMSPVYLNKYAIKKIKDISNIDLRFVAGINSGMAVNLSALGSYKYDENLFLDYVDFNFILDMRKNGAKIILMNSVLIQSFSVFSTDKNSVKNRFMLKKKDLRYFYKNSFTAKLFCTLIIIKMKIRMFLKFKDFNILKW